ncbi:MAG: hypothetical protein IKU61_00685 [Clostridia bacterium]|nr:hypothetical protein [Clostridia bacterium]
MKRIIALTLVIVVFVLSFSACGESNYNVPLGMQIASDSDNVDYLLYVPEEWTVDMRTGVTTAYYSVNDPSNISVTMHPLKLANADAFFDNHIADLNAVFTDVSDIETANLILDKESANQYVYTAKFNDIEYKFWQVICIRKARVYTITYSSTTENYDAHTADMQTALDLFCFI